MKKLNLKITVLTTAIVLVVVSVMIAFAAGPKVERHQTDDEQASNQSTIANEDASSSNEDKKINDVKPLAEETISVLALGVDKSEKLTDVIMYVVFNIRDKTVSVLRIPRDCFVGKDFPTGKVNAIYGHPNEGETGIETLRNYLEEKWKLDIDYYATISLDAVKDIIDDLGGIKMNVEQTINYLPGQVIYPGEQVLDGEKSEWILRYRAGYTNGDLGRIDTQTKFLGACIDTAKQKGIRECLTVLMKNYKELETDMTLDKMLSLATNYYDMDKNNINMHVVPGNGAMYYSYAVYAVDEEGLLEILNESFVTQGKELTAEEVEVAQLNTWSYNNSQSQQNQNNSQWQQDYSDNTDQTTDYNQNDTQTQYDEFGNPIQSDPNIGNDQSNVITPDTVYDNNSEIQNQEPPTQPEDTGDNQSSDEDQEPKIIRRKNRVESDEELE